MNAAKWTHYGRWDDEGLRVLNQYGEVIYTLPHSLHQPAVLQGAIVVGLGSADHPAQGSLPVRLSE